MVSKIGKTLLAIDGGTHETGWALFVGKRLKEAGLATAPKKDWTHIRIGIILDQIQDLILTRKPSILVLEGSFSRWTPELGLLIKSFKKLAKLAEIECVAYNAGTVIRTVSGQKVPRLRANRKALLTKCVSKHYPKYADVEQDTVDAIAIGRTHLIKIGAIDAE